MRSPIKASAVIAICIALTTALGACSLLPVQSPAPTIDSGSAPTADSASAACDALEYEAKTASEGTFEGSQLFPTDAIAGAEVLAAAAMRFEEATATVEDEQVSALATDTSDALSQLSDLVSAYAADPLSVDGDALPAASADSDSAFVALASFCDWSETVSGSCIKLEQEFTGSFAELSVASDLLSTDPETGAGMTAEAAARFEKAADAVDNDEVSGLATDLSESLTAFSGLIDEFAADPDNPDKDALNAGSRDVKSAVTALRALCDW